MKSGGVLRRLRHMNRQGDLTAAAIALLPAVVVLGVFKVYPIFYTMYLSLLDWNGVSEERVWVGAGNYSDLLSSREFWNSLRVTITYSIGVTVLGLAVALLIALLLNSKIRGLSFYRLVYFTPVVASTVAAGVIWRYMLDTNGFVNALRGMLHMNRVAWLTSPVWALPAVILVGVWKRLGFNALIYLVGLQGIPREYYEAAQIDGAGAWARLRHVTVPLLVPTTLLLSIMSVIDSFLVFDQVYVLTAGGPLRRTEVVGYRLYLEAFRYQHVGGASALGLIILLIVLLTTLAQWQFFGVGGRQGR